VRWISLNYTTIVDPPTTLVSGKKIVYEQISREAFIEAFPVKEMAPLLAEMYQAFEGVGCELHLPGVAELH
jgi:hypothetical protein